MHCYHIVKLFNTTNPPLSVLRIW